MKRFIILSFIMLFGVCAFTQSKYPITTIFKGDTVVILSIKQSEEINNLIESVNLKLKTLEKDNLDKDLKIKNLENSLEKKNSDYVTLKIRVDSIDRNFTRLITFQKNIITLSKMGSIIYQRDNGDIYYINLRSYKWNILSNDRIVLNPIRDRSKWRVMRLSNVPEPDNLSLHLWPHSTDPQKLK